MDHSMASGFKPGMGTPVWSPNLTPLSEPEYIGALLGLFILSIGFRGLVAAQGYLEAYLHLHYYSNSSHTRSTVVQPPLPRGSSSSCQSPFSPSSSQDSPSPVGLDSVAVHPTSSGTPDHPKQAPRRYRAQGSFAHSRTTPAPAYNNISSPSPSSPISMFHLLPTTQPFVWQADILRALLTTAVIGIGYMLMLVVMTYNSAYFAVILAGIFVGEVYFARWGRARAVHATKPSRLSSSRNEFSFATSPYCGNQDMLQAAEEVQGLALMSQRGDGSPLSASTLQGPPSASLRPSLAHRPSTASSLASTGSRSSYQPAPHHGDGAC